MKKTATEKTEKMETTETKKPTTSFPKNGGGDLTDKLNEIKEKVNDSEKKEEPQKEKKRKRGSARAKEIEAQKKAEAEKELQESMSGIGTFLMNLIIKRLPNPIPLEKSEGEMFERNLNKVLAKYVDFLGTYQEESALILTSVMILTPRFYKPKKIDHESTD